MSSDEHSFSDSGVDVCSDDLQYKQDSPLLEYGLSKHRRDGLTLSAYSSRLWTYSMLFISLVFCCCSLVLLAAAFIPGDLDTRCESKMTGWSPLLDSIQHTNEILKPDMQSIYNAGPSTESDQAWNNLWHYGATGISDDKLALLNKSTAVDWVRHGDEIPQYAGQIKAYFEGFHRIHCLHLVMQYAFQDSFNLSGQHFFNQEPHRIQDHVEHCIDNIRWGIDCNSDVTPYLIKQQVGADGKRHMRLDLQKPAKCRDIESMQRYAAEHTVGGLRDIVHEH